MTVLNKLSEEILNENIHEKFVKQKNSGKKRWKLLSQKDRLRISDLFDFLAEHFAKDFEAGLDSMPKTAPGTDIRFPFNREINGEIESLSIEEAQDYVSLLLKTDERFSSLVVTISLPRQNFVGVKLSNKFPTLIIAEPYVIPEPGVFTLFVTYNKKTGKQLLSGIQLKPEYFNVNGKTFTYNSLYNYIMTELQNKKLHLDIKQFLVETLKMIDNTSNYTYSNKNIILKRSAEHKKLNPESTADTSIIYKNFGEIIQPLVFTKKDGGDIFFPKSGGEQLIDFKINDKPYSTKYKEGAPPSIKAAAEDYLDQAIKTLGEDHILVDLFKSTIDKKLTSSMGALFLAKKYLPRIWPPFVAFLEVDDIEIHRNITPKALNKKIIEYNEKDILEEKLNKFYIAAGLNVRFTIIEKYLNDDVFLSGSNAYGLLAYPIRAEMNKLLDNNLDKVKDAFIKLINANSEIIQLKTYDTANELKFLIEHFNKNIKISFLPGGAYNSPNNQSIRFRVSGV